MVLYDGDNVLLFGEKLTAVPISCEVECIKHNSLRHPMLQISLHIALNDNEIEFSAIRSQGSGGQNVNKVASAVHLRFDINTSSLPDEYKQRLLDYSDQRISSDGIIVIKAQQFRTQEKNREDALNRLRELILAANKTQKPRKATKPTKSAKRKRLDSKSLRSQVKSTRRKVSLE
jgi:ribosome-associated protein